MQKEARVFLDAFGRLGEKWPAAMRPFCCYFRNLVEDGRLDRVQALAENFTSEENFRAVKQLEGESTIQMALMHACYRYALDAKAN
jgi:hypothetical protein